MAKRKNVPDINLGVLEFCIQNIARNKLTKKAIDSKISIVLIPNRQVINNNKGNNK